MKHAIDKKDVVTITIRVKNELVTLDNGRGFHLAEDKFTADTLILSMLYQTLQTQLNAWRNISDNYKIQLQIHEVID